MSWSLKGTVLVACNCDYGCPCNYNARPTTGDCEGGWMWIVDKGELRRREARRACALRLRRLARRDPRGQRCRRRLHRRARRRRSARGIDEARPRRRRRPVGDLHQHVYARRPASGCASTSSSAEHRSKLSIPGAVELAMAPIANPVTGARCIPGTGSSGRPRVQRGLLRDLDGLHREKRRRRRSITPRKNTEYAPFAYSG